LGEIEDYSTSSVATHIISIGDEFPLRENTGKTGRNMETKSSYQHLHHKPTSHYQYYFRCGNASFQYSTTFGGSS
jgi:hypothetical protein